jgi:hypothetical protein
MILQTHTGWGPRVDVDVAKKTDPTPTGKRVLAIQFLYQLICQKLIAFECTVH